MADESFFQNIGSRRLTTSDFDEALQGPGLTIVFMWGHNCPNCDIAKKVMGNNMTEVLKRSVRWYDVNVYEQWDLGTRFGLHGIPVFLFFDGGRLLGKVTSFPGLEPFLSTIDRFLPHAD